MSNVSWAIRCCFSSRMCSRVRMLWVRSASFTRITRMSCAIAMIILRKFSACFSSCESEAEAENLELRQKVSNLERMDEVGLYRMEKLALVYLCGVHVGLLDQIQVGVGMVGRDSLENVIQPNHRLVQS